MRIIVFAALMVVAAGCSGSSEPQSEPASGATEAAAETCAITVANGSIPPSARDWGGRTPEDSHGNGKLWTLFWPHNVVIATPNFVQDDGAVRMKWPWWRGVRGELRISGHRLDAKAPPVRADIADAYGRSGFQPSAIFFPTVGCWKITGTVGDASLTFVTIVLKASRYSA
jgi:hypothetical protein